LSLNKPRVTDAGLKQIVRLPDLQALDLSNARLFREGDAIYLPVAGDRPLLLKADSRKLLDGK
jgi:hypothetical protein